MKVPGLLSNCTPCLFGHPHARTPHSTCVLRGRHAASSQPDEGRSADRRERPGRRTTGRTPR